LVYLERGVYVTIAEIRGPRAPLPRPLSSGFSEGVAYRVLGVYSPAETSECYLILTNDRHELWFICNRHCRVRGVFDLATTPLHMAVTDGQREDALPEPRAIGPRLSLASEAVKEEFAEHAREEGSTWTSWPSGSISWAGSRTSVPRGCSGGRPPSTWRVRTSST
jgi:hypothetical protein